MKDVVEIMNVLGVYESAPSAHCLVKSFTSPLTDSDVEHIYECSEGHNDSETERLLKSMSASKLDEIKAVLKDIAQEVKDNGEYDDDFHGDVEHIITSW